MRLTLPNDDWLNTVSIEQPGSDNLVTMVRIRRGQVKMFKDCMSYCYWISLTNKELWLRLGE